MKAEPESIYPKGICGFGLKIKYEISRESFNTKGFSSFFLNIYFKVLTMKKHGFRL